ncbi:hypothetical protein L1987_12061 [Smallanthus sonchifolius]|uniref:Uncharacterized protein n=1 Tax=Smallanthus sonchifolius TaxID=185202 RepID=A0ACB9JCR1_9ASTR|nr:hypothetical protein L1987_12061 [Smallanthus sonchifolius]
MKKSLKIKKKSAFGSQLNETGPRKSKPEVKKSTGSKREQCTVVCRFFMRLTKDESEINLASNEVDPEFSEWKWATPEEVIEQAVDYKRPTYEEVIKAFKPHLNDGGKAAAKCRSTKW